MLTHNMNSISSTNSTNSTTWIIGERYELMEKGGMVHELGTLNAILEDGSLTFKKADGGTHTYHIESGISYRLIIRIVG